jgi:hypothetical protein
MEKWTDRIERRVKGSGDETISFQSQQNAMEEEMEMIFVE